MRPKGRDQKSGSNTRKWLSGQISTEPFRQPDTSRAIVSNQCVLTVLTVLNEVNGQSGFEDTEREPGFYWGVFKVDPLAFMAHLPNIIEVWTGKKEHVLLTLQP